jgi:fatty acid-binding protein DegV
MMEDLSAMVDRARKQVIYVVHADIPRLAQMAIDAVHETLGSEQEVALAEVPPMLGAHVGSGTIALVFVGTEPRV